VVAAKKGKKCKKSKKKNEAEEEEEKKVEKKPDIETLDTDSGLLFDDTFDQSETADEDKYEIQYTADRLSMMDRPLFDEGIESDPDMASPLFDDISEEGGAAGLFDDEVTETDNHQAARLELEEATTTSPPATIPKPKSGKKKGKGKKGKRPGDSARRG